MDMLNERMESHKVPHELRASLREFLIYSKGIRSEREVLVGLRTHAPDVWADIAVCCYSSWVACVPCFSPSSVGTRTWSPKMHAAQSSEATSFAKQVGASSSSGFGKCTIMIKAESH